MGKVVFYSRANRPRTAFAPSSSGFAPVYEERINSDGVMSLVRTGEHNINEFVQTSLEGTKVYNILERFQLGDVSALEKVKGFYADVTQVPTSLLEAHNLMKNISKNFDKLPPDLKAKFGNSADKFIASVENGDFAQIVKTLATGSESELKDQIVDVAQKEQKEGDK